MVNGLKEKLELAVSQIRKLRRHSHQLQMET